MSSDNPRDGGCERIRQHFDGYLDGELDDATAAEVQGHLEGCPDCASGLRARSSLRSAVKQAVLSVETPIDLRRSIEQKLRQNSPNSVFRFTIKKWTLALAATLLVTVGALTVLRSDRAVEELMHIGLIDHTHCTLELERWKKVVSVEDMRKATGRTALGEDFIGLLPLLQEKIEADFDIVQGHRCTAEGRRYVHFILTGKDGAIASVIVSEKNGESFSGARADTVLASGLALYRHGKDGLDIAAFETDRYLAYFVSNLDEGANMKAAETLAPAMSDYLQRIGA
jgi:anti-sigma factor (TIGR02949 family)